MFNNLIKEEKSSVSTNSQIPIERKIRLLLTKYKLKKCQDTD